MQVDNYVVITAQYVVICDTLLCPEDMELVIATLGTELQDRQLLVINSHADWDHIWGNCFFETTASSTPSVPIIAQQHCRTRMLSEEAQVDLLEFQQRYPLFQNVHLTPPTLTFPQTLRIHGGDLTLELFSAPGHCPDHIALWLPELRLLLAFDAAETPIPLIGDVQQVQPMFTTLEHFLTMQPEQVFFSHGENTGIAVIQQNLHYLHEIEARCRALLSTHLPTSTELEHSSALIHYAFDAVLADVPQNNAPVIDHTYYSWVHEQNTRHILQWLLSDSAITRGKKAE